MDLGIAFAKEEKIVVNKQVKSKKGEKIMEWHSVKKFLPDQETKYLVYVDPLSNPCSCCAEENRFDFAIWAISETEEYNWIPMGPFRPSDILYWMYMNPPEEENRENEEKK